MTRSSKHQLKFFAVIGIFIVALTSFSHESFAFRVGDADPLLNNMWLEPANPKPGDLVSIHSSVYNIGTESTGSVTDTVTIGYFLDGNLIKIDTLPDVVPGPENGMQLSTGPIWEATDGIHSVTMILNYHDTLSHLTDNSQNNIMQKIYYVGDWQESEESLVSFDVSQEHIPQTQKQQVTISGKVVLPENLSRAEIPRLSIKIDDMSYGAFADRKTGEFYFRSNIPVYHNIMSITVSFENERYRDVIGYDYDQTSHLYPRELVKGDAALLLKMKDATSSFTLYDFTKNKFTIIVYDESYQMLKSIDTTHMTEMSSASSHDIVFTSIPGNTKCFVEIYLDGEIVDSFQIHADENSIVKKEIMIPNDDKTGVDTSEDDI